MSSVRVVYFFASEMNLAVSAVLLFACDMVSFNAAICAFNSVCSAAYPFVEVLCTCPTNWHMTPVDAADHILTEAVKHFPLGVFKDKEVPRHEL